MLPIFSFGSNPIFSISSLLIPDFFANVSIVSLCCNFETSTPFLSSWFNSSINSWLASLSCFSRLIPSFSNSFTCSSVGFLLVPFPLHARLIRLSLLPIFSSGFNPIFSISSLLIPDFFANVSIVSLWTIFEASTLFPFNFFNVSINSWLVSRSCFSRLIPSFSNSFTCSSVGFLPSPFPLYTFLIVCILFPIFSPGFSPMFSTSFLLISDLFANVSIVSLLTIFETSTPISSNCFNNSINSWFISRSSRLIPSFSNSFTCSSVGFLPLLFPLYAFLIVPNLFPIFSSGSNPIFSISSLLIPDFFANVSIVSDNTIFETSTPFLSSWFNSSINSWLASLSCFSKLIPISVISFTCSSVGFLYVPFPLYARLIPVSCVPIFCFGSNPIFSTSSLLIPDFFANVSIVSLSTIFDCSTPILCSFFKSFINLSTAVSFSISSTTSSNSTKSFRKPSTSNRVVVCFVLTLSFPPLITISLSGSCVCHRSISAPRSSICFISCICFSSKSSKFPSRYFLYFACMSFNAVA